MDHLLLQLLLHHKLPLHQEGLPHLHEGVPHPDLSHDQDVATNHVQRQVQQNPNEDGEDVPESINLDNGKSWDEKEMFIISKLVKND